MIENVISKNINAVWENDLYQEKYKSLQKIEKTRKYCGHDISHFLDVARLMWTYNTENGTGLKRDVVYATALLHDIGRYDEAVNGKPHHEAGADLAGEILKSTKFTSKEKEEIAEAIRTHRDANFNDENSLRGYLYRADKRSRACFCCKAANTCSWPIKKRNLLIDY